jgi:hypothetical protein
MFTRHKELVWEGRRRSIHDVVSTSRQRRLMLSIWLSDYRKKTRKNKTSQQTTHSQQTLPRENRTTTPQPSRRPPQNNPKENHHKTTQEKTTEVKPTYNPSALPSLACQD